MNKKKRNALIEAVVAFLPLVAMFIGFYIITLQPQGTEVFSPSRTGFVVYLFPVLIVAYFIFLYFILSDIYKKLAS